MEVEEDENNEIRRLFYPPEMKNMSLIDNS
jgi:hypothetical protein